MRRCIELASLGAGYTAPNPQVGAVLVHEGIIIGEGYHRAFGQAHAEVNCIESVRAEDRHKISQSTLYVSLEPCSHFGKTPPCSDLIIDKKIPHVVIGCLDPHEKVNGRGMAKLLTAGIHVEQGILAKECRELNRRFFTTVQQGRPYYLLKWAETADGFIGGKDFARLRISGHLTNRLVHRWRAEEAAIMIGTNTAAYDDPELSLRHWPGRQPQRVIIDRSLRLPASLKLFAQGEPLLLINGIKEGEEGPVRYLRVDPARPLLPQLDQVLFQQGIQSVLVEGGAGLLHSFIEAGHWDEARIICNENLFAAEGIRAPILRTAVLQHQERWGGDLISYFRPA